MEGQIRRLAAAAESLELQARELRAEIRDLADALSSRAANAPEPAEGPRESTPAAPPAGAPATPSKGEETGGPAQAKPSPPAAGPEGARLVALSMALDGKPREETAQHLRDTFGLEDVDDLLADVYARAGS